MDNKHIIELRTMYDRVNKIMETYRPFSQMDMIDVLREDNLAYRMAIMVEKYEQPTRR